MSSLCLRRRAFLQAHRFCTSATLSENTDTLTFNVARRKLRYTSEPSKVIDIFNSVQELNGVAGARAVRDLVVRRLVKSQRFSDIETLLENQKKHPHAKVERFLSDVILAYGRAKMADQAIKTFYQMDELGCPRTVSSFNVLLTALKDSEKFDRVTELFDEIPTKFGISPDHFSYSIFLKSLCDSGSPDKAYEKLKEMNEKGITVTNISYTTLIDGFYKKKKPEEAEKIWDEMVKNGCSLDTPAYNAKLIYIANHGKPEEALKLLGEMEASNVKPDALSYNFLLMCYLKNGEKEEAKKVYEEMASNSKGCYPNQMTYRIFMRYLVQKKDYDLALEVCKESIRRRKAPKFQTVSDLIKGLVKNSKEEEAKQVIKMVHDTLPPNVLHAWKKFEAQLDLNKKEGSSSDK
ncbi:hypothetical protein AMTRI_Chr09g12930 [Amborella trichopoda]